MSRYIVHAFEADPHSGCVRSLHAGDRRVPLAGSGCEFGDWYGFFSQERMGGTQVDIEESRVQAGAHAVRGQHRVRLPSGRYLVDFEERVEGGAWVRDYRLKALPPGGALGDLVLRCALDAGAFPRGRIAGRTLRHRSRNRMAQFATREARLESGDLALVFQLLEVDAPPCLGVYTYLRDAPERRWIMHHRLLTTREASDEYVLRVRHAAYSSYRHRWVRPARRILWRASERHPWIRPTIQVGGNLRIGPGQVWRMRSCVHVVTPGRTGQEGPA